MSLSLFADIAKILLCLAPYLGNRYLDKLGLKQGYLVDFDPAEIEWEEKIYIKEVSYNDKTIIMIGV